MGTASLWGGGIIDMLQLCVFSSVSADPNQVLPVCAIMSSPPCMVLCYVYTNTELFHDSNS